MEGPVANKTTTETRAIRQRLGLTQEDMARQLGVPLRTFTRWDSGATEPNEPTLKTMRAMKKKRRS